MINLLATGSIVESLLNEKSRFLKRLFFEVVPGSRFELPRPFERHPLKVVRLPISPPGQLFVSLLVCSFVSC